jgi:hypothetical protein
MFRTRRIGRVPRTIVKKESKTCLCAAVIEVRQTLERSPCKVCSLDLDETQFFKFWRQRIRRREGLTACQELA